MADLADLRASYSARDCIIVDGLAELAKVAKGDGQ